MKTEPSNIDTYRDVNIDISDLVIFRNGGVPPQDTPQVTVSFTRDDVSNMQDSRPKSSLRYICSIKETIIDWCARAAGGLDEAEFFCIGMNVELNSRGDITRGETIFKRRYML